MIALLLATSLLGTSCAHSPTLQKAAPAGSTSQLAAADLFPEPTAGISIQVAQGKEMKLDELLEEFSKVTAQNLLVSREVVPIVKQTPTGLTRSVEVPAAEVYPFVESILAHNDLVLTPLTSREPRLLAVGSLTASSQRGSLRNSAVFVPAEGISAYSRHPAILVTTMVNLPHVDVRTLSNSMHTMITDANTQQIIPVGNSNSLILTGFGPRVASLVATLQACDEQARRDLEALKEMEKKAWEQRPAKPIAPAGSKEEAPK